MEFITFGYCVFAFLMILQIGDVATTYYALKKPGVSEGNGIMAFLMDKLGILNALIAVKLILIIAASFAIIYFPQYATIPMMLLCIFYSWVVVNNYRHLKE